MIKNNNRYIKIGLLCFALLLVLVEGTQKIFGYRLKTGKEHAPFTWSEILDSLPSDILMISIVCIIIIFILKQAEKFQSEKEKEYAQKRKEMDLKKNNKKTPLSKI